MRALEREARWPEVGEGIAEATTWSPRWVSAFGLPEEQALFERTLAELSAARASKNARRISRLPRRARQLGAAGFERSDAAVESLFFGFAARSFSANEN